MHVIRIRIHHYILGLHRIPTRPDIRPFLYPVGYPGSFAGYPARKNGFKLKTEDKKIAGFPAAGYPAISVSGATLIYSSLCKKW